MPIKSDIIELKYKYIEVYRMPRPEFNDYTFYKIVNINGDVDLCYVGSTCNMKQRRQQHKDTCSNENNKKYNVKLYQTIREHGGFIEFKMIEIGTAEQLTLTQARQIEEEFRVELKANMNTQMCFRPKSKGLEYSRQYRIDNDDKIKEREKQYRIDNYDKRNKIHTCECGMTYRHLHKARHLKTQKHIKFMQEKLL